MEIKEYLATNGRSPFRKWFDGLNSEAAAKVTTAVTRMAKGNLSNVDSLGQGVHEYKIIELNFGGNQPMLTSESRAATSAVFRSAPAGLFLDRHPAPRRQFLVTLSGSWEIEASNGVKRVFEAGDVMLADDTTGEGHTSRVLGSEPHVFMTVPLAE